MKDFSVEMLRHSFPQKFSEDTAIVACSIPKGIYVDGSFCKYKLLNGENIEFPYRIYGVEKIETPSEFSLMQKIIFHAFLSRRLVLFWSSDLQNR